MILSRPARSINWAMPAQVQVLPLTFLFFFWPLSFPAVCPLPFLEFRCPLRGRSYRLPKGGRTELSQRQQGLAVITQETIPRSALLSLHGPLSHVYSLSGVLQLSKASSMAFVLIHLSGCLERSSSPLPLLAATGALEDGWGEHVFGSPAVVPLTRRSVLQWPVP